MLIGGRVYVIESKLSTAPRSRYDLGTIALSISFPRSRDAGTTSCRSATVTTHYTRLVVTSLANQQGGFAIAFGGTFPLTMSKTISLI